MFDLNKLKSSKLQMPTRAVDVSATGLIELFGEDEKAVFTVRGLTGNEFAKIREEQNVQREKIRRIIMQNAAKDNTQKAEGILLALGLAKEKSELFVFNVYALLFGVVTPELDEEAALIIAEKFHGAADLLAGTILQLSNYGATLKKKT